MKLLIITSIQDYEKHIPILFKKAEICAFSSTNIKGHKTIEHQNLQNNWFSSGDDDLESSLYFTFTEENKINIALELIKEFNLKVEGQNPMHAIVLSIEKFIS
jgi:hypothetical protein